MVYIKAGSEIQGKRGTGPAVVMTGRIAVVKFGVNLVVNGCFNKRYYLELRVLLLTWVASACL